LQASDEGLRDGHIAADTNGGWAGGRCGRHPRTLPISLRSLLSRRWASVAAHPSCAHRSALL